MTWSGPADFFAMGGYALYVWGAYGVTAACLLVDPIMAARRHRRALREAADGSPDNASDNASDDASDGTLGAFAYDDEVRA